MSNDRSARPAIPKGPDDELFPIQERLRLRENLGLALRELRERESFAILERGPWAVFQALSSYWQSNAEAWPSQEALAKYSGYTARAVRDFIDELERGGFLRVRRQRRPDGSERIYYAPGPVTLAELAAFIARYPQERPSALRRNPAEASPRMSESFGPRALLPPEAISGTPPEATSPAPAETVAGAPPEAISAERRDLKLKEPFSWRANPSPMPLVSAEEEQVDRSDLPEETREIARVVLTERLRRKHPRHSSPKAFDPAEIALVAACCDLVEGDREEKLRVSRDAIEGAFLASKDGPPSVKFIWGKFEHFLDHAERGRKRAIGLARATRPPPVATPPSRGPQVVRVEAPVISAEQRAFARFFDDTGAAPTTTTTERDRGAA